MEFLLNHKMAKDDLFHDDDWARGHGYIPRNGFLGTSMLYFGLVYMLPAKTSVVLGSGGGYVPRMVRQAQREVPEQAFVQESRCILIDACIDEKGFGKAAYYNDEVHFLHVAYPDIEIWKMTTDDASQKLKEEGIKIDFLHIDADHTFAQSLKDFENYLPLMSQEFVITMHDTAVHHLEIKHDGCVPRTIAYLRKEMQDGGKYEHLEMINFNNRRYQEDQFFKGEFCCLGTAIIKPKTCSIWDTQLAETTWLSGNTFTQNPSK